MALFNKDNPNMGGDNPNDDDSTNPEVDESVEFIPSMPKAPSYSVNPAALGATASQFLTGDNFKNAQTIASAFASGDVTAAVKTLAGIEDASLVAELLSQGISALKVAPSTDRNPPTGGAGKGFANSFANANRLSADMAPTEIRLSTGIKPNVYSPDYHNAEANYASPLHVTCVNFRFPTTTANNTTASYIASAIGPDILNRVQSNIGFTLPSTFTVTNLLITMNVLCQALEMYYSISRLLVYGNDPMNKNEAVLYLRGQINSTVADEFLMLKRLLEGTPIPPNLNAIIFYISQIYLSSELPGSPAIMIAPHGFPGGVPDWSSLSTIRTALGNLTSTAIFTVLGKAFPSWSGVMPLTGVANPLHDPNFSSIWTNLPFDVTSTSGANAYTVKGPSVTSITDEFRYNAWTNNLDGAAYAMMSAWKSTATTGWIPGFLTPLPSAVTATYTSNRLSWMDRSGVVRFYESDNDDSTAFTRDETYTTSSRFATIANSGLQFGSERCYGVSCRSIQDTAIKLADWAMSFETMPKPYAKFVNSSQKSSSGKSYMKGKSKSKGGNKNESSTSPRDEL